MHEDLRAKAEAAQPERVPVEGYQTPEGRGVVTRWAEGKVAYVKVEAKAVLALLDERDRLRKALEEISIHPTNFAGVVMRDIARAALAEVDRS